MSVLLTADAVDRFRHDTRLAVDTVAAAILAAERPATGLCPATARHSVAEVDLDRPLDGWADVLDEVRRLYLDDAVWFHHPRYVGHLNCPVALPAAAADLLATAVNSSMDTWDQSAAATMIERRLVGWTTERIGYGDKADGVFTSGGTQSNLQALLLAREESLTGCRAREDALPRLRVLASVDAHFSVRKAADLLGMASDAVVPVPVDAGRRMDPVAVGTTLARLRTDGLVPMAVVATAGTTDFGAVDPLGSVAEACRSAGCWLHVDAAYGGGLLVSRRRRYLLDGIEFADSVTVDFHKTFFQPVASSAVLVRDRRSLRHVTLHADYLNPADADPDRRPNQVDKSLQTTRRFDALKLWCTLRALGPDRIGAMLDEVLDLARDGWRLLDDDPDFEVLVRPTLSTLVFRYAPPGLRDEHLDAVNAAARESLFASGEAVVAGTRVDGRVYLKMTLLNPAATIDDLRAVLELLREHGSRPVVPEEAGRPADQRRAS